MDRSPWRIVNDPGAWGSQTPEVLVLGFSKGFTQANAYKNKNFDRVPFDGMRPRLTEILQTLGLLGKHEIVDHRMVATEKQMAFGSLVRCSLSRWNEKPKKPKKPGYECTGEVILKAFTEAESAPIVHTCAKTYLSELPPSVRLVVMLGVDDLYIKHCKNLIRTISGKKPVDIKLVSYRTGKIAWVHASHPSPLNGWHTAWVSGPESAKSGAKRTQAQEAVALAMGSDLQEY